MLEDVGERAHVAAPAPEQVHVGALPDEKVRQGDADRTGGAGDQNARMGHWFLPVRYQ